MKKLLIVAALAAAGSLYAQVEPTEDENPSVAETAGVESTEKKKEDKKEFNNDMKVTARVQARAVWIGNSESGKDRPVKQSDVADASADTKDNRPYGDARVRRLRLGVKGKINKKWEYVLDIKAENLINPSVETSVETEVDTTAGTGEGTGKGNVTKGAIQEASVGYKFADMARLRYGQIKIPFSRESMTSSSRLLSLERSLATEEIGHQFDLGAQVDGYFWDKKIFYGVGAFNGNGGLSAGKNKATSNEGSPFVTGRLQIDPLGQYKNGKSMFSNDMLVSIGGGAYYQDLVTGDTKPFKKTLTGLFGWTADIAFNFMGLNVQAAYYDAQAKSQAHRFNGYWGQVAYFVLPKFLQPWLRYETYTDTSKVGQTLTGNDTEYDLSTTAYASGGVNLFFTGNHKIKLSLAYYLGLNSVQDKSSSRYVDAGTKDDWTAVQMQITF